MADAARGGAQSARTIHFFALLMLELFLVVHVAMIIGSGFKQQIRSMTLGKKYDGKCNEAKGWYGLQGACKRGAKHEGLAKAKESKLAISMPPYLLRAQKLLRRPHASARGQNWRRSMGISPEHPILTMIRCLPVCPKMRWPSILLQRGAKNGAMCRNGAFGLNGAAMAGTGIRFPR